MWIGAELIDVGGHLPGVGATEVVARGAIGVPDWFALGDLGLIQCPRPRRRLVPEQPVGHPVEARRQHRFRGRAHGHCSGVVAFVDLVVIAVPMQVHRFPRLLVPDLRQVDGADGRVIREAEHHHFRRVEGVGATRALLRPQLLPGVGLLLFEQSAFRHRDDQVAVVELLEKTQLEFAVDRRHYCIGGEFRVAGTIVGEPLKGLQLQGVGRRAGHVDRDVAGIGPVGAGVTQRAVRFHGRVADLPLGHADRQVLAVLIEKAEDLPAAGLGQFFRAHLWQHGEQVIRDSRFNAQADGGVFVMIFVGGVFLLRHHPQHLVPGLVTDETDQRQHDQGTDLEGMTLPLPRPGRAPLAPAIAQQRPWPVRGRGAEVQQNAEDQEEAQIAHQHRHEHRTLNARIDQVNPEHHGD